MRKTKGKQNSSPPLQDTSRKIKGKNKETAGSGSKTQSNRWNPFAKGRQVRIEDLSSKDVIIGVMGPTGSGKSSFIEIASGINGIVGHTLKSCTDEISVIKFSVPELDSEICLVDTPGFDDTNKSDVDIFRMVSEWLNDTYERDIQLAGLLYFHRITDNRMAGTPLKNLRLFEKLCGKKFSTIVLTTTMWDEIDVESGEQREQELQDNYWKSMIDRGSTVKRFLNTHTSAFDILRPILTQVNEKHALLLQREVTDLGLKLKETAAGRILAMQLEELVPKQQKLLVAIRTDLMESTLRPDQLERLQQEYQEVSAQLHRVMKDVERMKISMGEQFLNFVGVKNWSKIRSMFRSKREKPQRQSTLLTRSDKRGAEGIVTGDQDNATERPHGDTETVLDKESEVAIADSVDEDTERNLQQRISHNPTTQELRASTKPAEYQVDVSSTLNQVPFPATSEGGGQEPEDRSQRFHEALPNPQMRVSSGEWRGSPVSLLSSV